MSEGTLNINLPPPNFKDEIEEVNYHTARFCQSLRIKKESLITNNMNPVLDYVHWLRFARKNPTPEQLTRYKDYQINGQIQTGLRERNHAGKSAFKYYLKDGHIYNPRFPDEPFENLLNRGLEWSQNNNSPEPERDKADVSGWKNSVTPLIDAPLGAKRIQITGEGIVEGTTHGDNFVDIYEKIPDPEHGWIIRTIRFSSGLSYDRYQDIALKKDPHFFDGFKGPIDAWFTEHILEGDSREVNQIFAEDFGFSKGIMQEDKFGRIFQKVLPVAMNYARVLRQSHEPLEIIKAFKAVLVENDLAVKAEEQIEQGHIFGTSRMFGSVNIFGRDDAYYTSNIQERINWLVRQEVLSQRAGCGISAADFNIFGKVSASFSKSFIDYLGLSNSVGKLGLAGLTGSFGKRVAAKTEGECIKITCRRCGWQPSDQDHSEHKECPECSWAPGQPVEKPK